MQQSSFIEQNEVVKQYAPLKSQQNTLAGYKFIDLFSGIGGIRLPFDELGARCVFSSEMDKYANQTYFSNYNELPKGDITQIDAKDIPSFDILLAGFPCQPFSNAGHKKGFEDTRGTLFFDICRIIDFHKPKVLFLENVKGLRSHNKGHTYITIKSRLEELGYEIYSDVLNAKSFGLPQNRERIYIIGFKKGLVSKFTFPSSLNDKPLLGSVLESKVPEKYTISDKLWIGHQRRKQQHISKGNGFGYSLFNSSSEYTSTLSARYYKDGSEILISQRGNNPRKITPREAARLQGFPDSFIIPVSDVQAYKQFGNSVAVPVIRAIAKKISEALK